MMRTFYHELIQRCALISLILVGVHAQAQVSLPNGTVEAPAVDLRVKVLGGQVTLDRQWWDGNWRLNLRWAPAELAGSPTGSDGCLAYPQLKVQGRTYSGDGQAWLLENRYSVRAVDYFAGTECLANRTKKLKWQDRMSGQWLEYERTDPSVLQFRLARFGDRNDVTVTLNYDTSGKLKEVRDHFNNPVLKYTYTGDLLTQVEDVPTADDPSPARVVKYTWGTTLYKGQTIPVITEVKDVRGNLFQYTINNGQLQTIKDGEGRETKYTYLADRVVQYLDPDGNGIEYTYDFDKLKKEFYAAMRPKISANNGGGGGGGGGNDGAFIGGLLEQMWHDIEGQIRRQMSNGKAVVKRGEVDTINRTEVVEDSLGRPTTYTRDEYGNIINTVVWDGSGTSARYSAVHGQKQEETNALGIKTQYEYDPKGNLVRRTEAVGRPDQRVTEYDIDQYGQITKATRKGRTELNGSITPDAVWKFTIDNAGNVTEAIDPENKTYRYTYDRRGNELSVKDPLGKVWQSTYDLADHLTSEKDPLGHGTTWGYDKNGNQTSVTDGQNKVWRTIFDGRNRPIKQIDPLGNEYTTEYNILDYPVSVTDASGKRMRFEYDSDKHLTQAVDGKSNTYTFDYTSPDTNTQQMRVNYPTFSRQFRFDNRDRVKDITLIDGAEGRVQSFGYDAEGQQKTLTDANGKTRYYEYDAYGAIIQVKDPLGNAMNVLRDTRGNVIAMTDPLGKTTKMVYDRNNLLLESTDPLAKTTRYRYNDNGWLTEIQQANGQKVGYRYDDAGRVDEHREYNAVGALIKTTTYSYDDNDNLLTWNDGNINTARAYDDASRLQSETVNYGSFSLAHRYTWHPNNQMASYTGPDGVTITYDYDEQGQVQNIGIPGEGNITVTDWKWTAAKKVLLPGGTEQRMDYDGFLALTQMKVVSPAQTVLFDLQNQFNQLSQLAQSSRDGTTLSYTYDDATRLTKVDGGFFSGKTETYEVDALSNRTKHSRSGADVWSYDDANQLTSRGPLSYQYDASGNQIKKTDIRLAEPARTTNYAYDAFNRLSEVTDGSGQLIARYTYDPFDRRLSKTLGAGASGLTPGTTWYLPSEWGVLAEADAVGSLQTVYGWHPLRENGSGPVYAKVPNPGGGTRYVYYHNDQFGTPQRISDKGGNLVWSADYDGFGRAVLATVNNGVTNNLRYPGQYYDAETGLHYNDRRFYDPDTGRYLTRDPIGFEGGINLYSYTGHNPTNFTDPTGQFVPLACLAYNYLRCLATCSVISVGADLLLNCGNANWAKNLKDCALECLLAMLPIPNPCGKLGQAASVALGAVGGLMNSFPGDTLVHVKPEGATAEDAQASRATLKPIRDLQPGDEVIAWSEWKAAGTTPQRDARLSYEKVIDIVSSTREQQIIKIALSNGETLEATAGHPFHTTEGWRDAVLLKKGGQLLLKGSGDDTPAKTVIIAEVTQEQRRLTVYNLEVQHAHTFFVGTDGVLVHNGRCTPKMRREWEKLHGKPWPKNPPTEKIRPGGNQDGHHIVPVGRGGHPTDPSNITPMTPSDHMAYHKKNGYR